MHALSDYDYNLPTELIAQKPAEQRDRSNLLYLERKTGKVSHQRFNQLDNFLDPGDVLVVNNTAVVPGRLLGKKASGGKVEVLICNFNGSCRPQIGRRELVYECLVKAAKPPKPGSLFYFDAGLAAEVIERRNGTYLIRFHADDDFETLLYRIGKVPLPPYIKRRPDLKSPCDDRVAYQTVYASEKGAVAAPTAGLHFTSEFLERLKAKGVAIVSITLHVGYASFLPVRSEDIRNHKLHSEAYCIAGPAARTINAARAAGHRLIAVGTTCVRTLEYASNLRGDVVAGSGCCDLFIYPGYTFKVVDAMLTNFHLPKSSLLMLVSAFAGRKNVLRAYRRAVERRYRFYSYGDAMFIL